MSSIISAAILATGVFLGSFVCMAQERAAQDQASRVSRVALLIGNSHYQQSPPSPDLKPFGTLRNPCNDVTQIAAILEADGWDPRTEIIKVCDVDRKDLRAAIDQFKDTYLAADPSFGFVYYSGHGMQLANDTYLFGTDAFVNLHSGASAAIGHDGANIFRGGVRLFGDLISQVGNAGSGSIFIVVDACRETPIESYIRSNPDLASGFMNAQRNYPEPVLGIKLLYSNGYGKLASDGMGGGSPFAIAFEDTLKTYGRVDLLVSGVIRSVRKETMNSSLPQVPDTTGSLNEPPEACLTNCGAKP